MLMRSKMFSVTKIEVIDRYGNFLNMETWSIHVCRALKVAM